MSSAQILKKTKLFVIKKMSYEGTGHDWFHVERVLKMSLKIVKSEEHVDIFILQMIALLHDLSDWKFTNDTHNIIERELLKELEVGEQLVKEICQGVQSISFKGGANIVKPKTIEAKIVQDADRLDALGAVGIARTFAYGGYRNREIYNPKIKPKKFTSHEEYKKHVGTTINHFYEKLFHIRRLMHTKTAKRIAKKREQYMKNFLDEFYVEWDGEK